MKEVNNNNQPKPYEQILIIGPGQNLIEVERVKTTWEKCGLHRCIVGNGINPVTFSEMQQALSKADEHTHVHLWGHGNVAEGKHRIHITPKSQLLTTAILNLNKDSTWHVWSCYAGAVANEEDFLKDFKAPVILHSGQKYTTLLPMNAENIALQEDLEKAFDALDYPRPDAYAAFEASFLRSPETVIFLQSKDNEIKRFKATAPKHPMGIASIETYVEYQLNEFREFRKNVLNQDASEFLDMSEFQGDAIAQYYTEQALIMEAGRMNSKYGTFYVQNYLELGIDVDSHLESGLTAKKIAEENNNQETINLLNEARKHIITKEEALIEASKQGDIETVKALLKDGISPDTYDLPSQEPAITIASQNGYTDIVEALLDAGAHIETYYYDYTALLFASKNGHHDTVQLLLDRGAATNVRNDDHCTPFFYACMNGDKEMVELFLEHEKNTYLPLDIQSGLCNAFTPLMAAVLSGKEDVVKLVLDHPNMTASNIEQKADEQQAREHGAFADIPVRYQYALNSSALEMAGFFRVSRPNIAKMIEDKQQELSLHQNAANKENQASNNINQPEPQGFAAKYRTEKSRTPPALPPRDF